jgi:hypothetical protein
MLLGTGRPRKHGRVGFGRGCEQPAFQIEHAGPQAFRSAVDADEIRPGHVSSPGFRTTCKPHPSDVRHFSAVAGGPVVSFSSQFITPQSSTPAVSRIKRLTASGSSM